MTGADATIAELFRAFAARDADALVAVCAPDVRFEPASTEVARRPVYEAHGGMRAYVADVERTWEHFEVTIGELREAGPLVVAYGRVYARAGGFLADSPIAFVLEVGDDGLLRWGRTFTDRAAADAFAVECARCEPPS